MHAHGRGPARVNGAGAAAGSRRSGPTDGPTVCCAGFGACPSTPALCRTVPYGSVWGVAPCSRPPSRYSMAIFNSGCGCSRRAPAPAAGSRSPPPRSQEPARRSSERVHGSGVVLCCVVVSARGRLYDVDTGGQRAPRHHAQLLALLARAKEGTLTPLLARRLFGCLCGGWALWRGRLPLVYFWAG
jgi:hypothetical protein